MIEAEAVSLRNTVLDRRRRRRVRRRRRADERRRPKRRSTCCKDDVAWWADVLDRARAEGQLAPGNARFMQELALAPVVADAAAARMSAMKVVDTLRSVMHFRKLELDPVARRLATAASVGGPPAHRQAAAAARRVRLHRRRRRGRAHAAQQQRRLRPHRVPAPRAALGGRRSTRRRRCSAGRCRSRSCWRRPGSPASPIPQGELAVARAAARADLPYTLSTLATRSIEEVAAVSDGRKWFQVYAWRDRGLVKDMVERCRASGYEALVMTVDTAVLGRRERDVRRGLRDAAEARPRHAARRRRAPRLDVGVRPRRADRVRQRGHVAAGGTGDRPGRRRPRRRDAGRRTSTRSSTPNLSWDDVDWFRSMWDGPIIVKGIQCVADAVLAAERGVDAIALSNHGGRQLDSAPAPIELVAPVVDAVGDRTEVICDGGVRRGSDIVKAVALGATACMAGRAYLYGLGAAGERGVDHVLSMLHTDVRRTMALLGASTVADLTPDLVVAR